jgi:hypothetical protein
VLVKASHLAAARDLMLADGFRAEKPMTEGQQASYVDHQGELELVRDADGLWLELHTAIVPGYYSRRHRPDDLWDRLVPARLGRNVVDALAPPDELEALCVHGSKHRWERLIWILDVAMMVRLLDDGDWDDLLQRARRHGTLRMVFLGLLLAETLANAQVPPAISTAARGDRGARTLAGQVKRELFEPRDHAADALLFHARMRERKTDQLRYLLNVAFRPSGADWERVTLPRGLSPLYVVARPVRLALKYGRRLIRTRF